MFALFLLVALVGHLLFSFMFARRLSRTAPHWSRVRVIALAALPLPLIIWGLCGWAAIRAATASPVQCLIDDCGMTLVASTYAALTALVLFVLGCGAAALAPRSKGKAQSADTRSVSE